MMIYCFDFFNRMEKLGLKLKSSLAKFIGTIILIIGALLMTFYIGPPIFSNQSITPLNNFHQLQISTKSNWILGGFLLATANLLLAILYIVQVYIYIYIVFVENIIKLIKIFALKLYCFIV